MNLQALIFDCDGVLVDTERDGHRVAFNRAFQQKGLQHEWSIQKYGDLLKIGGGKERMRFYFDEVGRPDSVTNKDEFILEMHKLKTDLFMQIIGSGELPLRPGVARLVDEAIAAGVKLVVCSTSNERAVNLIVAKLLGEDRKNHFSGIFAGDMAKRKKPDPEIYNLAISKLDLNPDECVVVEDSRNGLLAAKAAGFPCLITTNGYTVDEDFSLADKIVPELGDQPTINITLKDLDDIVKKRQKNENFPRRRRH